MAVLALDRARTHRSNTFSIPLFGRSISSRDFFQAIRQPDRELEPLAPPRFLIYEYCVIRIGDRVSLSLSLSLSIVPNLREIDRVAVAVD